MPMTAQRQFLVKIAGIDGFWGTLSGGEVTTEQTRAFDGGQIIGDILESNPSYSDITVSRPFKPERDAPIVALLSRAKAQGRAVRTTISRTPTDEDLTPLGDVEVWEVQLRTVTPSESDAASGDASRVQLVWGVRTKR